jgi:hypothetical protein
MKANRSYRLKRRLVTIWLALGLVGAIAKGRGLDIFWWPKCLEDSKTLMLVKFIYQAVQVNYMGAVFLHLQDLNCHLLTIIEGYAKYLKSELKALDLKGSEGKKRLVECVEKHRKLQM